MDCDNPKDHNRILLIGGIGSVTVLDFLQKSMDLLVKIKFPILLKPRLLPFLPNCFLVRFWLPAPVICWLHAFTILLLRQSLPASQDSQPRQPPIKNTLQAPVNIVTCFYTSLQLGLI